MQATQATAERTPDLVNVRCTDWEGLRHADLDDVVRDATVGEIVDEARRTMGLPMDTSYQAVLDGRQLNHMETLEEAGIDSDVEMEIVPDVHAG
ncbi:MAG: hypothetical protein ACE5I7_14885 [Candidatus Binatia bacterium]